MKIRWIKKLPDELWFVLACFSTGILQGIQFENGSGPFELIILLPAVAWFVWFIIITFINREMM